MFLKVRIIEKNSIFKALPNEIKTSKGLVAIKFNWSVKKEFLNPRSETDILCLTWDEPYFDIEKAALTKIMRKLKKATILWDILEESEEYKNLIIIDEES